ncbi:adhesion G protein-coupled receptor E3-like [Silurus meridionalis]|nr:adhesion G protein-coupled receptor E3-like [Silurus meridionalis]
MGISLVFEQLVTRYLNMSVNLMNSMENNVSEQDELLSFGNRVLNVTHRLISFLMENTNIISFPNLEFRKLEVKPGEKNITFTTSDVSLDMEAPSNGGESESAAVAFMSYADMEDFLKPNDQMKVLMSNVVSVTLPKTQNKWLTQPINITFKHIREFNSEDTLSCVYWNEAKWVQLGCNAFKISSTHTKCSCDHLSVFALIKNIVPCKTLFGATVSMHCEIVLNMPFARGVGIFFLTLCLLTFAFCCQNSNETNAALINLCLNLLLFDLLDQPNSLFQLHLQTPQSCAIMKSLRRFFFISTFVWMFIETVVIFLFLKNISQIRSNLEQGLRWNRVNMVGYLIPVVVVIVCTAISAQNDVNGECWETKDEEKKFDYLILFIVASNVLLYIIIIIMMVFTLKQLRNMNLQRPNRDNTNLVMRVMFKSLAQFIILGCYWILRYIPTDNVGLYNVFLFLNTQQGTFIFIVHCLLNQEVRQKYRKIWDGICCYKNPGEASEAVETQETQH